MLALDHALLQSNLWLKSGKQSHIYLHLPTNSNTSKHVNMDMVCNIKPHTRRGSSTCKQMHSINLDSLSLGFKCWDDHTYAGPVKWMLCIGEQGQSVWSKLGVRGFAGLAGRVGTIRAASTVSPQMVAHLWASKRTLKGSGAPGRRNQICSRPQIRLHNSINSQKTLKSWGKCYNSFQSLKMWWITKF